MSALEWLTLKPRPARPWVQMAVPTQLCRNNRGPVRALPGHAGARGDPHLCCADGACAPSLWGLQRRSSQGVCEHLILGIPAATFRRGARGPGSPQEAEPTLGMGSQSSLRELFVSGTGKWVICQESAGPWLRLNRCINWAPPIHARFLLNIGRYFYVFPTQHLKADPLPSI